MAAQRNSKALTDLLFDELDALKAGTSTPQQARAKAALANTICAITRLEMDYARFVTDQRGEVLPNGERSLKALPMGAVQ